VPLPAGADEVVEAGLYDANMVWHPARSLASDLSGPVQFRVCLAKSGTPAPAAVFAVHCPEPSPQWHIDLGTFVDSMNPYEWVYYSPVYSTPAHTNGDWEVWCQIPGPEPPVGGGGDAVVPPPDQEDAAGASAATVESWEEPGYGWPPGFPAPDENHNDKYAGPGGVTAKNLSISELSVTEDARIACSGPFVGVSGVAGDACDVPYEAGLDDGDELPESARLNFIAWLSTLCPEGSYYSLGEWVYDIVPAPCTVYAGWPDVLPGVYRLGANADEPATGDTDDSLSSRLSLSSPELTWQLTGIREGILTAAFAVTGPDSPGQPLWVEKVDGPPMLHDLSQQPGAVLGANTVPLPVPAVVPLIVAGRHVVGFTYEDEGGPVYHNHEPKWAPPMAFSIDVPGSVYFTSTGWHVSEDEIAWFAADAAVVWLALGEVIGQDLPHGGYPPGQPCRSFYGTFPPGPYGPRGGVVSAPSIECVIDACKVNTVVHICGHGNFFGIELSPTTMLDGADLDTGLHPELAGTMTGVKLADLCACNSLGTPAGGGIDDKFRACGVQATTGYYASPVFTVVDFLDLRLWYHLTKEGATVAEAVARAKSDWSYAYPTEDPDAWSVTSFGAEGETGVSIVAPF